MICLPNKFKSENLPEGHTGLYLIYDILKNSKLSSVDFILSISDLNIDTEEKVYEYLIQAFQYLDSV